MDETIHLVRREKLSDIPFVIQQRLCTELNPKLKERFDVQIEASKTGYDNVDIIGKLERIGQAKETIEKAAWDLYYEHSSTQKKGSRNKLDLSAFGKWQALKYVKYFVVDNKANHDEEGEIKFGKDKEAQKAVEEYLEGLSGNGAKIKSKSGKITILIWPTLL